jgi:hypothetical protein
MATARKDKTAGISDDAVKKATGKTWKQWITALDKAGCRDLEHKAIAQLLHDHFDIGRWWSQMVTVGYEQGTGKRAKHEKPGGFEISRTRVIQAPVSAVFQAWLKPARRSRWLKQPITIRKSTANKSMRVTWADGVQRLSVEFYAKGEDKSQVAVQHGKLPHAKAALQAKRFWSQALSKLKGHLES